MPSSWFFLLFAILMTAPLSTSYAGRVETLSDTDLDKIGAAGEMATLQVQTESKLSADELKVVESQGVGPSPWGSPSWLATMRVLSSLRSRFQRVFPPGLLVLCSREIRGWVVGPGPMSTLGKMLPGVALMTTFLRPYGLLR